MNYSQITGPAHSGAPEVVEDHPGHLAAPPLSRKGMTLVNSVPTPHDNTPSTAGVPLSEVTQSDFMMVRAALVRRLGGANEALVWTRIHYRCDIGHDTITDDAGVEWWAASREQLADETGLSPDQAYRAVLALRAGGFIDVTEHRIGGNYDRTKSYRTVVAARAVDCANSRNGVCDSAQCDCANSRNVPLLSDVKSSSVQPKAKKAQKRATSLDDSGFVVTAELVQWTRVNAPAVDGAIEADKFFDYWKAVGGQRGRKTDWTATFRNWMRTAQQRKVDQGWKPTAAPLQTIEQLQARREALTRGQ